MNIIQYCIQSMRGFYLIYALTSLHTHTHTQTHTHAPTHNPAKVTLPLRPSIPTPSPPPSLSYRTPEAAVHRLPGTHRRRSNGRVLHGLHARLHNGVSPTLPAPYSQ